MPLKKFRILAPLLKAAAKANQEQTQVIQNQKPVSTETAAKPSLLDNPNKPKEVKPLEDISSFSITGWLNKKKVKTEKVEVKDNLPANHFSEVDLLHEWKLFLDNLQDDDPVKFSAIKVCKLQKRMKIKFL